MTNILETGARTRSSRSKSDTTKNMESNINETDDTADIDISEADTDISEEVPEHVRTNNPNIPAMWRQPPQKLSERNKILKKQLDMAYKRQVEEQEKKKRLKLAELEAKREAIKK